MKKNKCPARGRCNSDFFVHTNTDHNHTVVPGEARARYCVDWTISNRSRAESYKTTISGIKELPEPGISAQITKNRVSESYVEDVLMNEWDTLFCLTWDTLHGMPRLIWEDNPDLKAHRMKAAIDIRSLMEIEGDIVTSMSTGTDLDEALIEVLTREWSPRFWRRWSGMPFSPHGRIAQFREGLMSLVEIPWRQWMARTA